MGDEQDNMDCPVCGWPKAVDKRPTSGDFFHVECARCGIFDISRTLRSTISSHAEKLHILSGYLREANEAGTHPKIGTHNLSAIESIVRKPKKISDSINKLMLYLGNHTGYLGKTVEVNSHKELSVIFAENVTELTSMIAHLQERKLIKVGGDHSEPYKTNQKGQMMTSAVYPLSLTVEGLEYYEDIDKARIESNQAFVAMSFHPLLLEHVYGNVIKPVIDECGYDPVCMAELQHTDDINDRIIAEIRKSKFMVADFTQQRGGVYFEAGFARGRDIPVIWCCNECDKDNLHFDTEHFSYIFWTDPEHLRDRLKYKIQAIVGVSSLKQKRS